MKDSKVNTVNYNKCVQNERQQGKHVNYNKCVQNERQQGKHSEL